MTTAIVNERKRRKRLIAAIIIVALAVLVIVLLSVKRTHAQSKRQVSLVVEATRYQTDLERTVSMFEAQAMALNDKSSALPLRSQLQACRFDVSSFLAQVRVAHTTEEMGIATFRLAKLIEHHNQVLYFNDHMRDTQWRSGGEWEAHLRVLDLDLHRVVDIYSGGTKARQKNLAVGVALTGLSADPVAMFRAQQRRGRPLK